MPCPTWIAKHAAVSGLVIILLFAILYIDTLANFFHLKGLNAGELGIAASIAAISVLWFEVYKWVKRLRQNDTETSGLHSLEGYIK